MEINIAYISTGSSLPTHPEGLGWTSRELDNRYNADTDIDLVRLKAALAPHSGDWFHAAPIALVGLKLSDEEIRIAVAQRLGITICSPHNSICGKLVDARGLRGLSCIKSKPRHQRHAMLNDLI